MKSAREGERGGRGGAQVIFNKEDDQREKQHMRCKEATNTCVRSYDITKNKRHPHDYTTM